MDSTTERGVVGAENVRSIDQENGALEEIERQNNDDTDETLEASAQLVQEEEREKGRVGYKVYWKYLTTLYGGALVPLYNDAGTLETKLLKCSFEACSVVQEIYSSKEVLPSCQLCKEEFPLCKSCHLCPQCHLPTSTCE
ncbi:hypothetical protein IFM89_025504 [Coptis chinensis]|uniref:Uncharacterized protein n=1 Tax=Coptis chinensis TaxID=261450 RepID=A0A835H5B9_9MAGN|nr:hypothetical protein IFM89_025504 [Coptis chinensis]